MITRRESCRVRLRYEERSRQWVVSLEKLGASLVIYRSWPGEKHRAETYARDLAEFLKVKLVEDE